jgi:Cu-processing system permease protein
VGWRWRRLDGLMPIVGALGCAIGAWWLAEPLAEHRRLLLCGATLTLLEVAVVAALATFFAAFSSAPLTALMTLGVFLVGRSADTLAELPERVFGEAVHRAGQVLSHVVPNLMIYVPSRTLVEASGELATRHVAAGALQCLGWCSVLLGLSCWLFARRDLS